MRGALAGSFLTLAVAPALAAQPLLVSPEPANDGFGVDGYAWTAMSADLHAAAGPTIPTSADLSNLPALLNYDAVWVDLREVDTGTFSPGETAALSAYIATGRRVVLIGGNSDYANWNASMLALVGGTDGGDLPTKTYASVAVVPLTTGVSGLYAQSGGKAVGGTTLFADRVATVWGPARNVVVLMNPLSVSDYNIGQAGNAPFAKNLAGWAAGTLADPACLWTASGVANWRDGGSWVNGAMPSVADDAVFNTAAVTTAGVAGQVTARNVTVKSGRLTLNLPTANASVTVGSAVTVNGGTTLTMSGSGSVVSGTLAVNGTLNAGVALTVSGGTTTAAGSAVNVLAGGSLTTAGLSAARPLSVAGRLTVTAPSRLALLGLTGGTGQFDVTSTAAVLVGGDLTALTAATAVGCDGGRWDGPGIVSSAAAADAAHLSAVGVIANAGPGGSALYPTFAGQPAAAADVLVRQTVYGDADLNGVVNAADYVRLDAGFLAGQSGWGHGDFNYDGVVDGSDYTLADNAFNTQSTTTPSAEVAAVPEPAGAAVVTLACLAAGRRRRRPA